MYCVNGTRLRRWTIGRYPTLSLADAHEKMKIAAGGLAKHGIDPAAEKTIDRASKTIGDLAQEYVTKHAKVKKSSWAADDWQLKRDVLPVWRHRRVKDITWTDVVVLLDTIADPAGRNAPHSAVHVRRLLSKMFNFALARTYGLEYNPVQGTEPPAPNGRRTRVLDGREIGALMHALDEERECGYWLTAAWHRLILLTGQPPVRASEFADGRGLPISIRTISVEPPAPRWRSSACRVYRRTRPPYGSHGDECLRPVQLQHREDGRGQKARRVCGSDGDATSDAGPV